GPDHLNLAQLGELCVFPVAAEYAPERQFDRDSTIGTLLDGFLELLGRPIHGGHRLAGRTHCDFDLLRERSRCRHSNRCDNRKRTNERLHDYSSSVFTVSRAWLSVGLQRIAREQGELAAIIVQDETVDVGRG